MLSLQVRNGTGILRKKRLFIPCVIQSGESLARSHVRGPCSLQGHGPRLITRGDAPAAAKVTVLALTGHRRRSCSFQGYGPRLITRGDALQPPRSLRPIWTVVQPV